VSAKEKSFEELYKELVEKIEKYKKEIEEEFKKAKQALSGEKK